MVRHLALSRARARREIGGRSDVRRGGLEPGLLLRDPLSPATRANRAPPPSRLASNWRSSPLRAACVGLDVCRGRHIQAYQLAQGRGGHHRRQQGRHPHSHDAGPGDHCPVRRPSHPVHGEVQECAHRSQRRGKGFAPSKRAGFSFSSSGWEARKALVFLFEDALTH